VQCAVARAPDAAIAARAPVISRLPSGRSHVARCQSDRPEQVRRIRRDQRM